MSVRVVMLSVLACQVALPGCKRKAETSPPSEGAVEADAGPVPAAPVAAPARPAVLAGDLVRAGCRLRWAFRPVGLEVLGAAFSGGVAVHLVVRDGVFHVLLVGAAGHAAATSLGFEVAEPGSDAAAGGSPRAVGAVASGGDRCLVAFGAARGDAISLRVRAVMPDGRILPLGSTGQEGAAGGPVIERAGDPAMAAATPEIAPLDNAFIVLLRPPPGAAVVPYAVTTPTGRRIAAGDIALGDPGTSVRPFPLGRDVALLGGRPTTPAACFACPGAPAPENPAAAETIRALEPGWYVGTAGDRAVVVTSAAGAADGAPALRSVRLTAGRIEVEAFAFADGWIPRPGDRAPASRGHLWRFVQEGAGVPSIVAYDSRGAVAREILPASGIEAVAVAPDGRSLLLRAAGGAGTLGMCEPTDGPVRPDDEPILVDWRSALADASPPGGRCAR